MRSSMFGFTGKFNIHVATDSDDNSWLNGEPWAYPVIGNSKWKEGGVARAQAIVGCLREAMIADGSDVAFKLDSDVAFLGHRWLDRLLMRIAQGALAVGHQHNSSWRPDCFFGMCYGLTMPIIREMTSDQSVLDRAEETAKVLISTCRYRDLAEDVFVSKWIRMALPNSTWLETKRTGHFPIVGWDGLGRVDGAVKVDRNMEMIHVGQGGYRDSKTSRGEELAERIRSFSGVLDSRIQEAMKMPVPTLGLPRQSVVNPISQ